MQITLGLPDDVARDLEAELTDLPRTMLESFVLEAYRSGKLTDEQVRKILGYGTRMQVDGSLKDHGVYLNYGQEDLEQDMETLRQLREKEQARG